MRKVEIIAEREDDWYMNLFSGSVQTLKLWREEQDQAGWCAEDLNTLVPVMKDRHGNWVDWEPTAIA